MLVVEKIGSPRSVKQSAASSAGASCDINVFEIFMIEGHTDAVGSDAYNLSLSRQRAQAVEAALTRYYVIMPENLATVGLGERYLKIWTPGAEEENRRVALG